MSLLNYFLNKMENDDFRKVNRNIKIWGDDNYGAKIVSTLLNGAIIDEVYSVIADKVSIKNFSKKKEKYIKENNNLIMDLIFSYKTSMEKYEEELFDELHCCKCHRVLYKEIIDCPDGKCCIRCGKKEMGKDAKRYNNDNRGWNSNNSNKSNNSKKRGGNNKFLKEEIEKLKLEVEKLKLLK